MKKERKVDEVGKIDNEIRVASESFQRESERICAWADTEYTSKARPVLDKATPVDQEYKKARKVIENTRAAAIRAANKEFSEAEKMLRVLKKNQMDAIEQELLTLKTKITEEANGKIVELQRALNDSLKSLQEKKSALQAPKQATA